MKIKFGIFGVCALFLILIGCSSVETVTNSVTVFPMTSTSAPVITPSRTNIPVPMPSATTNISQKVFQTCVTVNKTDNKEIALKGVAVFNNLSPDLTETIYFRNLEKSSIKTLSSSGQLIQFWGVSPDRNKLLYEYDSSTNTEHRLAITDASGKTILDFDNEYQQERWDYFNWFDNQRIRVVKTANNKVFPRIYDPFTNDYRILRTEWQDAYKGKDLDWGLDWNAVSAMYFDGANIVYDPSLTLVVYPKIGELVSLTDVGSGVELAHIHLPDWGKLPRWSPNGKHLVIVASAKPNNSKGADEFFIVSKDGNQFTQLTHLANNFDQVSISEYAWSPDSKHIAFLLNTAAESPFAEGTQSELAILDVGTGEITNLCFRAISTVTSLGGPVLFAHFQPIWSPDGTQILIAQWDADSSEKQRKYSDWVIDIPSLIAKKIDENKQPVGWMNETP